MNPQPIEIAMAELRQAAHDLARKYGDMSTVNIVIHCLPKNGIQQTFWIGHGFKYISVDSVKELCQEYEKLMERGYERIHRKNTR